MKNIFNLYFNNIDQYCTRLQYWTFTLFTFGLIIILNLIEINLEINLELLVTALSILYIWPTVVITIKRLNDMGSENIILNVIIGVCTTIMPGWLNMDVYAWILIGIIPSGFIQTAKWNYHLIKG